MHAIRALVLGACRACKYCFKDRPSDTIASKRDSCLLRAPKRRSLKIDLESDFLVPRSFARRRCANKDCNSAECSDLGPRAFEHFAESTIILATELTVLS